MAYNDSQVWVEKISRRVGDTVTYTNTRVGQTLHIPCGGEGGHIEDFKLNRPLAPHTVVVEMLKKGWTVGSKVYCPKHSPGKKRRQQEQAVSPAPIEQAAPVQKEEGPMAENVVQMSRETQAEAPTSQIASQSPTAAAGKAKRLVYMALEDYYDEARKAYKPGHDDTTIAKSCGVHPEVVKKIREESYGPLAIPSDVERMNGEAKALRDLVNKKMQDGRDFLTKQADECRVAIQTFERKWASVKRRNGWLD